MSHSYYSCVSLPSSCLIKGGQLSQSSIAFPLFICAGSSLIWIPLQKVEGWGLQPPVQPLLQKWLELPLKLRFGHVFDIETRPWRRCPFTPTVGNARDDVMAARRGCDDRASNRIGGDERSWRWRWHLRSPILSARSKQTCVISVWHLQLSPPRRFHQTHDICLRRRLLFQLPASVWRPLSFCSRVEHEMSRSYAEAIAPDLQRRCLLFAPPPHGAAQWSYQAWNLKASGEKRKEKHFPFQGLLRDEINTTD